MAFKRHFLVMIWMAFSVLSLSAKKEWNADNVPIPFLQDSTQYVSDPDGYVDKALKDSANFYLQKLKLECGVQNVLIIVGRVANQDAFRMAQDGATSMASATRRAEEVWSSSLPWKTTSTSSLPAADWRES